MEVLVCNLPCCFSTIILRYLRMQLRVDTLQDSILHCERDMLHIMSIFKLGKGVMLD